MAVKDVHDIRKVKDTVSKDALAYACKVLPKVCQKLTFEIESSTDGIIQRLVIKAAKGGLYGCLYFRSAGVSASLCAQNKALQYSVVDFRGADNGIHIADFEKYIPVNGTVKSDFSDVIDRCHQFIDLLIDLAPWSGWIIPEGNWADDSIKPENEVVEAVLAFVDANVPTYGVHTKKELNMLLSIE